jgi:hypothetical protein
MRRRPSFIVSVATVLGMALIGLSAAPALATISAPIRLGYCGGDDWEPDVTGGDGGYVYALITHYRGDPTCDPASAENHSRIMIQVSSDGGDTFSSPQVVSDTPGGIAYPSQADPSIAVDPVDGAVYVAFLAYGLSGGHTDIYVARSDDHGATFHQVVKASSKNFRGVKGCKNCDHEKILARGGDVYLAYGQAQYHFLSVSTDGGASFTQRVVDSTFVVTFAEDGAFDAQGNVWFAWGDCESSNCTGSPAVDYRVSETLAGTTTTTFSPVIAQSPQGPDCPFQSCGFAYFGGQDAIAIDGGGTIYLAWQDGQEPTVRKSPPVIELSSCSSSCLSRGWTHVGRVDDKTAANCDNASCYALFPALLGGPGSGQVSATWMDDRNDGLDGAVDHVGGWNLWYRTSTNGGASWTTPGQRVSAFDPTQSQETRYGFLFPYGDYSGLDANPACSGGALVAWGEGHDWLGGPSKPGHIEFASVC